MLANESFSVNLGDRGNPTSGSYFDLERALKGGGLFNLSGEGGIAATLTHQSAWPVWLGIVGVGVAFVVLTKGKK